MMPNFKSLSNCFQNDCTLSYAPQKYMRVPVASHLCSDLILSVLYSWYIVVPPCSFTIKFFSLYDWYFFVSKESFPCSKSVKIFSYVFQCFIGLTFTVGLWFNFILIMVQIMVFLHMDTGFQISNSHTHTHTHTHGSRNHIWLFLSVMVMFISV